MSTNGTELPESKRREMARRINSGEITTQAAAREYGISRSTADVWRWRYMDTVEAVLSGPTFEVTTSEEITPVVTTVEKAAPSATIVRMIDATHATRDELIEAIVEKGSPEFLSELVAELHGLKRERN